MMPAKKPAKKREPRPALKLLPTFDCVAETQDAYVHSLTLRQLAKESGRFWSFHSVPTTVAMSGNRYAKSLRPFSHHTNAEAFAELLREYAEHGCPRPSGYADVFHERFYSPRISWSVNCLLAPVFAGGWQQAISPGWHYGEYRRYDMRSAYLWAATLGMPDVKTYSRSIAPWRGKYDGVYRIKLLTPSPDAPFPFNQASECLATNLEIETYDLKIGEVVDGVVWKRLDDPAKLLDAMRLTSTWKLAGRSYWGRWAQLARVECVAQHGAKRWYLPNIALNVPWAHVIVSRVKMRLWECATDAVHVYVDSVITPNRLPVGNGLGDWQLEKIYRRGVIVRGPGQYGDVEEAELEKMAGVPIGSPRRNSALVA